MTHAAWATSQVRKRQMEANPSRFSGPEPGRAEFRDGLSEKIGEGIGGVGLRDDLLLVSSIDRQNVQFGDGMEWKDIYHKCATEYFGIIKNHPFHDANKRTGFLSALYFIQRAGITFRADPKDFEDFTVRVSEGSLTRYNRYFQFKDKDDAEIRFIADYLRRKSSQIDKAIYSITFREMQARLRKYGFSIENPKGNFIDVVVYEARREFFGIFGKKLTRETRLGQIGFPGWSRQVSKGDIRSVLQLTRLTTDYGVDSASFFRGEDPIYYLISRYRPQIERLASR